MKITIAMGPFLPMPPLLGGAVERTMHELSRAFARRGHLVTVVSRLYDNLSQTEELEGVKHLRVRSFDRPRNIIIALLYDLVYSIRVLPKLPRADVIITNSFMLPIVIRRRRYGALCLSVQRSPKGQMRLYSHALRLISNSTSVARELCRQSPKLAQRVVVIPPPLPAQYTVLLDSSAKDRRQKTVLYVGRIHPEKGLHLLIDAFQELPDSVRRDWRLEIVGPWEFSQGGGGKEYLSNLRARAEDMEDCVEFIEPIFDFAALFRRYAEAEVFVYPSLAEQGETFGVAAMEAMAIGCCTIVSNLDCFGDFIVDEKTGFIFDHHSGQPATALSERLKKAMCDKTLRKKIQSNGKLKGQEFAIDRIIDQYEDVFENVLQ